MKKRFQLSVISVITEASRVLWEDRRGLPNQFREVGKSFLEKVMSEVWRMCGN